MASLLLSLLLNLISVANASALLILFPLCGGSLTFYCPFCSTKFYNILDASFVSLYYRASLNENSPP